MASKPSFKTTKAPTAQELEKIENYFLTMGPDHLRPILQGIRRLILDLSPDFSEIWSWGCVCFVYKGRYLGYLGKQKKSEIHFAFYYGQQLLDPEEFLDKENLKLTAKMYFSSMEDLEDAKSAFLSFITQIRHIIHMLD